MSYKHHTQQKRRKWAEQCVQLPAPVLAQLAHLEQAPDTSPALRTLAKELKRLGEAQFTCTEVEVVKDVLAAFGKVRDIGTASALRPMGAPGASSVVQQVPIGIPQQVGGGAANQ